MRVTVYLGSRCNLNCKYCHKQADLNEPAVSEEFLGKLAGEKDLSVKFMGGEPTLYMDAIKKFVDRLPNARFAITTNGVLLDEYMDFFRKHRFFICLSYDGAGTDMRGFDPFTKLINYPWLQVSCTLYHGNTDFKKIYDDFAEKEDVIGRRLSFYPHIMHVTNPANEAYKLTKDDFDSIISQTKLVMDEFFNHYTATGKIYYKYYGLYSQLCKRRLANYEYGETYCVNKELIKVDASGTPYSCQYVRDEVVQSKEELASIIDEKFPRCRNCDVYGMCGAACIKSVEHHLECYYYKNLYAWFKDWYEKRKDVLDEIKLPKPYQVQTDRPPFEDTYVFNDIRFLEDIKDYSLDFTDETAIVSYSKDGQKIETTIELSKIPMGESAIVLRDKVTDEVMVVYGYKDFLQQFDLTPQEYSMLNRKAAVVQVNRMTGDRYFTKCYPAPSQKDIRITHNGKRIGYRMVGFQCLHEIDRTHTFSIFPHELEIKDGIITTLWRVMISADYPKKLYLNYNGQAKRIREGLAKVSFPYKEGEKFYWGDEGTRYKGRSYTIEEA